MSAWDEWAAFLANGGRYDAPADVARVDRARRYNTRVLSTVLFLAALAVILAVTVLVVGVARVSLLIVIVIVLLVIVLLFLPKMLKLRRNLRTAHDERGIALSVSSEGLATPLLGLIRWNEMIAVLQYDDTARTQAIGRIPITGFGTRVALKSGEALLGITIGVRDATALRARLPEKEQRAVRLWGKREDAVRPGDVTLYLDSFLPPEELQRTLAALRGGAQLHSVPYQVPSSALEYMAAIGAMFEEKK